MFNLKHNVIQFSWMYFLMKEVIQNPYPGNLMNLFLMRPGCSIWFDSLINIWTRKFFCSSDVIWWRQCVHGGRLQLTLTSISRWLAINSSETSGGKHAGPNVVGQRTVQDEVGKALGTVSYPLKVFTKRVLSEN